MDSLGLQPIVSIPLIASLLFLVVSHPTVYKITNKIGNVIKMPFWSKGSPTLVGMVAHALVVFVIMYYFLQSYYVSFTSFASMSI
jgi:hypothetical protein